jgi:CarD family transcriptional regulator
MVTKKKTVAKSAAKATVKGKAAAKPVAKAKPQAAVKAKSNVKSNARPAAKAAAKPAPKAVAKPVAKAATKPTSKPVVAEKPMASARPAIIKPIAVKPVTAAAPKAAAPVSAKASAPPPAAKKMLFKVGELVVYPAHGVGKITNIEEQEIAGSKLELYIVDFEKEKLRLKVPTNRAEQKGMRHLADRVMIETAMKVIRGRARIKRTMWSRRAQEYDAKINSGDMIAVAEVIRDLYRSERQPEQSYSERQLFEQALARFARELAAVRKVDEGQCIKELEDFLARNAKRGATAAAEKAEEDAAEEAA